MKKAIAFLLVVVSLLAMTACSKTPTLDEAVNDTFSNVDRDRVEELKQGAKKNEAGWYGDTYCSNCDKVNAGKVRICTYCGQYIK